MNYQTWVSFLQIMSIECGMGNDTEGGNDTEAGHVAAAIKTTSALKAIAGMLTGTARPQQGAA